VTVTAPLRPRITEEVIATHRRQRLLDGLAAVVAEKGWRGAQIADIVRSASCGRKTFYDTFKSKGKAGQALLGEVCPLINRNPEDEASVVLAVELAALWRSGQTDAALEQAQEAQRLLADLADRDLQAPVDDDSLTGTLPPGRHGLPKEFVRANQRHRLLSGLAEAVAENSYACTTIAHVTRCAAVSRRTFYEHFESIDAAGAALLESADVNADPSTTLGAVAVEVVSSKWVGGDGRTAAELLVSLLIRRFREAD